MDKNDHRFIEELRNELRYALGMIQTRLTVENPEKTFSCGNVIGALNLVALEYCLQRGITPQKFVDAVKAGAAQLELEMTTRTGLFAPRS